MMQTILIAKQPIQAHVVIPGSKSITNRALLLAALAHGQSEVKEILLSDDTRALLAALSSLGVVIEHDAVKKSCFITGCDGVFPHQYAVIQCGAAGTVARFLLAACAAMSGTYHFDGLVQLRKRPLSTLITILLQQGAQFSPLDMTEMPFTMTGAGKLKGGEVIVDSTETGQFASALLMVAPFAKDLVKLHVQGLVSAPYVAMTCAMMADFGVDVQRLSLTQFQVAVPQFYQAKNYFVEPDLSTASYFFAAAAVTGGEVTIQAVDRKNTKQGDIAFLDVLEKMGCHILESATGLTVKGPQQLLQGLEIDMHDFSDTFMTLAAIAPFAQTPTTMTNIGHTRKQESDRITAMRQGMERLGIQVEEGNDWIRIYPGKPRGATIDSYHDHRIAMAFSIIGLKIPGIKIQHAECVAKTCPDFFAMWEKIVCCL